MPFVDIGELRCPANKAPLPGEDLGRDFLRQTLTFDLVGTRWRWCALRSLDHVSNVSNGVFRVLFASSCLRNAKGPPQTSGKGP